MPHSPAPILGTVEQFVEDAADHGYLGGDNLIQILERSAPALDALLEKHRGSQIVGVAHNVVNRVYVANY
ncbi:MAG: histidine phosphatase family protein [Planctomycetaceae bacterium]|nr:histidine phosphatase family protein [Planctomycetales bacterium]MCB9937739.1 histidine phosphatase family protein [Planctomycetaceae bacterium]